MVTIQSYNKEPDTNDCLFYSFLLYFFFISKLLINFFVFPISHRVTMDMTLQHQLDLSLQSVHITTKVVASIPIPCPLFSLGSFSANFRRCVIFLGHPSLLLLLMAILDFLGGGNQSTRRKPLTCCKSLANFITKCCIEYNSSERDLKSQHQW